MNAKASITRFVLGAPVLLLGCTTQDQAPSAVGYAPGAHPLPQIARYEPMPRPHSYRGETFAGHICKLGTSCMDLDPRPFEPCLITTTRCTDKAGDSLLVDTPPSILLRPRGESR
jgi:hypothetical protein